MRKKGSKELTGVKEIARRANVSIATVDRVIHNRTGVSKQTKEKINQIIKELNYQPNLLAQRLASRKTVRIATLIPQSSKETSFWETPLKGIEQAESEIQQLGIAVEKFFYDQNSIGSFVEQSEKILALEPDGILLAPSFIEESIAFTEKCKKLKIPYVLIDSDLPNEGSLCYIGPNLFHTGYLSAHLISYLIDEKSKVLVVNISKELDNQHHLLKKEEGFRKYFIDHGKKNDILKIDIHNTDSKSIKANLKKVLSENQDIKVVFVTNSRVLEVANFLQDRKDHIILVGFDFIPENIEYLKTGVIDFLIAQKPMEQAYKGVMALYHYLALSASIEKVQFMPIDIITKENYAFYRN